MERLLVEELAPGTQLDEPLYAAGRKLLLAPGNRITPEMYRSLERSDTEYVFLGEWDQKDFENFESPTPVSEYREAAEAAADRMEEKVEADLSVAGMDVKPGYGALATDVDEALHRARPRGRLREYRALHQNGIKIVGRIFDGKIHESRVAKVAGKIVDDAIVAFLTDRSLLTNLTNLRNRSQYLYTHTLNVMLLAIQIAAALKYDAAQVRTVGLAALLHDLGMAMTPAEVVNAPRKLSPAELLPIRKHPVYSLFAISRMLGLSQNVRFAAYQCHERADGSGYPNGRSRGQFHKFAQIVAVADVFDALASDRPWRKANSPYRALEHTIRESSAGKFDSEIVRGLLATVSLFPVGCLVKLSTGETAKVVHANRDSYARPVVSVLHDSGGRELANPRLVDLLEDTDVEIEAPLATPSSMDAAVGF